MKGTPNYYAAVVGTHSTFVTTSYPEFVKAKISWNCQRAARMNYRQLIQNNPDSENIEDEFERIRFCSYPILWFQLNLQNTFFFWIPRIVAAVHCPSAKEEQPPAAMDLAPHKSAITSAVKCYKLHQQLGQFSMLALMAGDKYDSVPVCLTYEGKQLT